jgi:hypothetical protein
VARLVVNLPENIVFANSEFAENSPILSLQAGVWGEEPQTETGVVFDVSGEPLPLLSTHDLRKLIRWLENVVESLDGKKADKKYKQRQYYAEDDDDTDFTSWKK